MGFTVNNDCSDQQELNVDETEPNMIDNQYYTISLLPF